MSAAVAFTLVIFLTMLVVLIAVPYIALARIMAYNVKYLTVRTPRVLMSEAYNVLKTGDIVVFISHSHMPTNSAVTHTLFTHSGMLLREGELVYTSESQTGTELMPVPGRPGFDFQMSPGVAIAPFLVRVKYYTGSVFVLRLSRPLDPEDEERVKEEAEDLVGHPYPAMSSALRAVLFGTRPAGRHCYQHVAHLVDVAGLSEEPLEGAGYLEVCREIADLPGKRLRNGYFYEKPIELLYDIGTAEWDRPKS